jgi:hypothetical protein
VAQVSDLRAAFSATLTGRKRGRIRLNNEERNGPTRLVTNILNEARPNAKSKVSMPLMATTRLAICARDFFHPRQFI